MKYVFRNLLIATACILSFSCFNNPAKKGLPAPASQTALPGPVEGLENEIFHLINQHRQSAGLPLLQLNPVESEVAAHHSYNMAKGKLPFGHKDLNKRRQLIANQVGPVADIGENVAAGQTTAREVVDNWLQSPGHRKNIEGDYKLTGIGTATNKKGVIYFTQIFTK